jgi:hypothetical protein
VCTKVEVSPQKKNFKGKCFVKEEREIFLNIQEYSFLDMESSKLINYLTDMC